MRPPCELVQREYLPLIRSSLAKNLATLGKSQNQIAESLGITQAAVSKYLNQDESKYRLYPYVKKFTEQLSTEINSNSIRSDILVKEVCAMCMSLRIGSETCAMHRAAVPILAEENCQICSDLLSGSNPQLATRASVLNDMQRALQIIYQSDVFTSLVPQVRANLVCCGETGSTLHDVAGIPGRITIIDGKARSLIGPRFGASTHTASILLEMRSIWYSARACLCLSGTPDIVKAAQKQKVRIVDLKHSESDPHRIAEYVKNNSSRTRSKANTGIHVPGGLGVEPVLYIFGPSATDLGELSEQMGKELV